MLFLGGAIGLPLRVPYSLLVALAGWSERARRLAEARLEMAGPDEPDGAGLSGR